MNTLKYMIAAVSCASLLFGCSKADENPGYGPDGGGVVTVRFEAEGMKSGRNASSTLDDTTIGNVTGYRFTDGIFRETLHGEQGAVDGSYSFRPTGTSGEIVFIANDGEGLFGWMQPEISTYEEFMDASASIESMTSAGVLMTGRMELSEMQVPTMTVRMRRSVARIDLEIAESGVEIRKVSIRRASAISTRRNTRRAGNCARARAPGASPFIARTRRSPTLKSIGKGSTRRASASTSASRSTGTSRRKTKFTISRSSATTRNFGRTTTTRAPWRTIPQAK